MYCVNCGKEISAKFLFCPFCGEGNPFSEENVAPSKEDIKTSDQIIKDVSSNGHEIENHALLNNEAQEGLPINESSKEDSIVQETGDHDTTSDKNSKSSNKDKENSNVEHTAQEPLSKDIGDNGSGNSSIDTQVQQARDELSSPESSNESKKTTQEIQSDEFHDSFPVRGETEKESSFISLLKQHKAIVALVCVLVFVASLFKIIENTAMNNSVDNNESATASNNEQPVDFSTSVPEPSFTPTTATEQETTLPNEDYSLSDGPIIAIGPSNAAAQYSFKTGFYLYLYSLKTNQKYKIFEFKNGDGRTSNYYEFGIDPTADGNFFHRQLFDSKIEKMAVCWFDTSDSSNHVGWVDKNGAFTDVTNIVHPTSSGFSGTTPNDRFAMFASNDLFVFYDMNEDVFCYYDSTKKQVIEKYEWSSDKDPNSHSTYSSSYIPMNTPLGLNLHDRPTTKWFIYNGDIYCLDNNAANDHTEGLARDYYVNGDEITFFEIENSINVPSANGISHFGNGLIDMYQSKYANDGVPYYISYNSIIRITPETEYTVEELAYSNNTIVFTARRGNERALFSMPYNDRMAGSPEKIADIDAAWGKLFFWAGDHGDFDSAAESEQLTESVNQESDFDGEVKTLTVTVDRLNIRSSPSTKASKKGQTNTGDVFEYYDVTAGEGYTWYRIGTDRWIADKNGKWVSVN